MSTSQKDKIGRHGTKVFRRNMLARISGSRFNPATAYAPLTCETPAEDSGLKAPIRSQRSAKSRVSVSV